MKKRKVAAFFTALTVGLSSAMTANAMLSEDEQKAAYIEKAVKEALSSQTEKDTEQAEDTEEAAPETEAVTEEATEEAETETETESKTESATESESETESEKEESQTEKIIVAIDASHQKSGADLEKEVPLGPDSSEMGKGFSEGTTGTVSELKEYDLNLSVAEKLKKDLEERGYEVYMTRDGDESDLSEEDRAKEVNESGAQVLISLHANGGDDSSERGVTVLAPSYENEFLKEDRDTIKRSNALADIVIQSYCEETGLKLKGLYNEDNQILMNWSKIPVIILEMGYMSNAEDDAYMAETDNQQKMADGIADGIDLYFGRS